MDFSDMYIRSVKKCRKMRPCKKRGHKCKLCASVFCNVHILYRHMKQAHCDSHPYKRSRCPKEYNTEMDLQAHHKAVHACKQFQCLYCGYKAYNAFWMSNHARTHLENQFDCDHCNVKLSSKLALKEHLE